MKTAFLRLAQSLRLPVQLQPHTLWLAALALLLLAAALTPAPSLTNRLSPPAPPRTRTQAAFDKLPLYFVENRGQADAQASYYVQGRDKTIYFTDQGLTFVLDGQQNGVAPQPASFNLQSAIRNPQALRWALRLDFIGARAGAHPEGEAQTEAVFSYFKGHPSEWQTGLRSYSRLIYRNLWPGIDLVYAGTVNRMKYSFVVRPGADPNQIKLAWRGASTVKLSAQGELEVTTPLGSFTDERPVSYQELEGRQVEVATAYRVEDRGSRIENRESPSSILDSRSSIRYSFVVGAYDRSRELVIDPALFVFAGYIGGSGSDEGNAITVDGAGNAYITGGTNSNQNSFPDGDGIGMLNGPDNTFNGNYDAFVVKLKADGSGLVYVGYIGGDDDEAGAGIAVDNAGNAYITGSTGSGQASFPDGAGFGVLNGPDKTYNGGYDAFVAKIKADGTGLDYAGYIGGDNFDTGTAIAVDSLGNAYIAGVVLSAETTFPDGDGFGTLGGPDKTFNGVNDAFVVKVKADGTGLVYAGYIGGDNFDQGEGIAVDSAGNAYVTGYAYSGQATFPDGDGFGTLNGPDKTFNGGDRDAFVAKVNAAGTAFVYAGYIGGDGYDIGNAIAVDGAGNAYVTGVTGSTEATFPDGDGFGTLGGPDKTSNGGSFRSDAFVAKIKADGTGLVYASFIGGNENESGNGIALDSQGNVYITGVTDSNQTTFPDGDGFGSLSGADTSHNGNDDAFVVVLNAAGTAFVSASYIGGSNNEEGNGIAVDSAGNAYIAGVTDSNQATFPTGGGFGSITGPDTSYNGGDEDAFVAKLCYAPDLTITKSDGGQNFNIGVPGNYTLTVSNATGACPTTGTITVTDALPANLTLASFNGTGWSCTGTTNVSCTHAGPLASGASLPVLTLTVNVGAGTPPSITNTAQVATSGELNTTNNSGADTTTVGCTGTLSKTSQSFAANGGSGTVTVTIPAGCTWTAVSNDPSFITVSVPTGTATGSGTVSYNVGSHFNLSPRSGTISVAGQTFTVLQGALFLDVPPEHQFYTEIGRLSARGITQGCGGGNFCPDSNTTREQMAIFIERALGVFTPPAGPVTPTFADVPNSGATDASYEFIEDFAARGITQGCAAGPPRLYCPTANLTREQVAVFILRALGVFTPPAGPVTPTFADVPNSGATDTSHEFVEEFYRRGITQGCAAGPPRLYCPGSPVTRGQMAVFLVRAFNL
jgi:hypothetical protein